MNNKQTTKEVTCPFVFYNLTVQYMQYKLNAVAGLKEALCGKS